MKRKVQQVPLDGFKSQTCTFLLTDFLFLLVLQLP
jgi:hypothetical protein